MNRDEDGFFPMPNSFWAACLFLVFIVGVVFLGMAKLGGKTASPIDVRGCYSAANAPDILVDQHRLHVLQANPISVSFQMENHKGWALSVDRWLNFQKRQDGKFEIMLGPDFGEFLFVTREGGISKQDLGFDLINRDDGEVLHYSPTGSACRQISMQ